MFWVGKIVAGAGEKVDISSTQDINADRTGVLEQTLFVFGAPSQRNGVVKAVLLSLVLIVFLLMMVCLCVSRLRRGGDHARTNDVGAADVDGEKVGSPSPEHAQCVEESWCLSGLYGDHADPESEIPVPDGPLVCDGFVVEEKGDTGTMN